MDDYLSTRAQTAKRPSAGMRPVLAAVLLAFLIGAAVAWYLTGGAASLQSLFTVNREAPAAPSSPAPGTRAAVPQQAAVAGLASTDALDQRIAEMEQRLARLYVQAQAAEGNTARAEALLVAFAARRAIERGAPLGYLAEQLRVRFGDARPAAVRTIIEAARRPVTLDRLLARLDGLEPDLARAPASEGTWRWLTRQANSLFVVRREDSPSPAPARRIERARLFLESGRIEAAIGEVRMMPNAQVAREWIADAQRYADAQRALETLETAALLESSELRDGAGEEVGQGQAQPQVSPVTVP